MFQIKLINSQLIGDDQLNVVMVPGDHLTLLHPPFCQKVAEHINNSLQSSEKQLNPVVKVKGKKNKSTIGTLKPAPKLSPSPINKMNKSHSPSNSGSNSSPTLTMKNKQQP